jgi:hypothetical protein
MRPILCLTISLLTAFRLAAAPAVLFQMDQSPVTGNNAITNFASTNSAFWGTLKNSGALPTLIAGATNSTGNAWQFNGGYYLGVGPNAVTESFGAISNTAGLSVAFWLNYSTSSSFTRV